MTATYAGTAPAVEIDGLTDDVHRLLVKVRNGRRPPAAEAGELGDLARKSVRIADRFGKSAVASTIARLRDFASQLAELAAEVHRQAG